MILLVNKFTGKPPFKIILAPTHSSMYCSTAHCTTVLYAPGRRTHEGSLTLPLTPLVHQYALFDGLTRTIDLNLNILTHSHTLTHTYTVQRSFYMHKHMQSIFTI